MIDTHMSRSTSFLYNYTSRVSSCVQLDTWFRDHNWIKLLYCRLIYLPFATVIRFPWTTATTTVVPSESNFDRAIVENSELILQTMEQSFVKWKHLTACEVVGRNARKVYLWKVRFKDPAGCFEKSGSFNKRSNKCSLQYCAALNPAWPS